MADRTIVHTAAGDIRPEDMGVTLAHEHFYIRPTGGFEASDPVHPDFVRNVREARSFKAVGGNTIVDMSVYGFHRDVLGCRRLTEETGIPVWGTCGTQEVLDAFESYISAHDLDERFIGKKYPIEVMMHRSWDKFLKEGL